MRSIALYRHSQGLTDESHTLSAGRFGTTSDLRFCKRRLDVETALFPWSCGAWGHSNCPVGEKSADLCRFHGRKP